MRVPGSGMTEVHTVAYPADNRRIKQATVAALIPLQERSVTRWFTKPFKVMIAKNRMIRVMHMGTFSRNGVGRHSCWPRHSNIR